LTKLSLLLFVAYAQPVAACDVAAGFGIDIRHACAYLHRNWRRGLLKRRRVGGRFWYAVSARGRRKLEWYAAQAERGAS